MQGYQRAGAVLAAQPAREDRHEGCNTDARPWSREYHVMCTGIRNQLLIIYYIYY